MDTRSISPYIRALLRIIAGLLFMEHGTAKLLSFPFTPQYVHLNLASLPGIGGFIELIGGALVAVGLLTRPAAFLMSGEMAVAYFVAHLPRGFFPLLNGGEAAVLYCFLFLYFAATGAGVLSLDNLLWRRRDASGLAQGAD